MILTDKKLMIDHLNSALELVARLDWLDPLDPDKYLELIQLDLDKARRIIVDNRNNVRRARKR